MDEQRTKNEKPRAYTQGGSRSKAWVYSRTHSMRVPCLNGPIATMTPRRTVSGR